MAQHRRQQIEELIAHAAADFLARESNRQSLITITRATISVDFKNATIFFTVLPENMEEQALSFLKRQRTPLRTYLKKHAKLKALPHVDFELDLGEKSRQRLDELSK